MQSHGLSQDDRSFRSGFEGCTVTPAEFNHEAHVRLAYVYLVENDVETAVQKMRQALLTFIERNGIPQSKFHETITRAWVLAVRHFMNKSTSNSAADFVARNPELLDGKIMLTHYSASVLFSSEARASFVEPDLDPIPEQRRRTPAATGGAVLYAKGMRRVAAFYEGALGLRPAASDDDHVVLDSHGFQLVVLQIPPTIASTIEIAVPPVRRSETAIKLVFFVPSIAAVRASAPSLGGALNAANKSWTFDGCAVCDGVDPEGNVFQVRERAG